RGRKHEPDPAAVEERQVGRGLKKKPHAERVAVEFHRAVEVGDGDGDLADPVESKACLWLRHIAHCGSFPPPAGGDVLQKYILPHPAKIQLTRAGVIAIL